MAFKDLMMHLNTYPDATPKEAVDLGVRFAELLGAKLAAIAVEIEIEVPGNIFGGSLLNISGMVAAERKKSVENAQSLFKLFDAAAAASSVSTEHLLLRSSTSEIPQLVTDQARMRDLTIFPFDDPAAFQLYVAETVIFGSGRPVLALPADPAIELQSLDVIGIAWDFSRSSARAIADALPILQRAETVHVVTVINEKPIAASQGGHDLMSHLAMHGVKAHLHQENAGGRSIGTTLTEFAAGHQLDLLVMGAFGHSRFRDFFLGGATKSILSKPPLPVFLSF